MYHLDDRNHLHGTPIPTDWVRNHGRNLRPLEVGMELRLHEGTRYVVRSVTNCGASVGPIVISTYSEVDYRRAEGVIQIDARVVKTRKAGADRALPIPVSFLYRPAETWATPPHAHILEAVLLDRLMSPSSLRDDNEKEED